MLLFGGGFATLVALAVWIYCVIDVITTPETACRNLPKLAWVFIVLLLVDLGSIAWLLAGKPWGGSTGTPRGRVRHNPSRPIAPDDDPEFLAHLRTRLRGPDDEPRG